MSFDPAFRFYRDDPQERASEPLADIFPEVDAELTKRRSLYPPMVAKGRMTQVDADHELQVWTSIFDGLATCDDRHRRHGAIATWTEQTHCLRREIALRRLHFPRWVQAGRIDQATADRQLLLIESLHDLKWRWTWHDEAVSARDTTEQRRAA